VTNDSDPRRRPASAQTDKDGTDYARVRQNSLRRWGHLGDDRVSAREGVAFLADRDTESHEEVGSSPGLSAALPPGRQMRSIRSRSICGINPVSCGRHAACV